MLNYTQQIIFGTLLGNSKLEFKNNIDPFLIMKNKDQQWIESKAHELQDYSTSTYVQNNIFYWNSVPHPCFSYFHKMLYHNKDKKVSFDVLDLLMDRSIAIWYGDSGCLVGRARQNACLRTQAYGHAGTQTIVDWFNSVSIPCHMNNHRHSGVVVFTLEGTKTLFKMIGHILPENRYHLLS